MNAEMTKDNTHHLVQMHINTISTTSILIVLVPLVVFTLGNFVGSSFKGVQILRGGGRQHQHQHQHHVRGSTTTTATTHWGGAMHDGYFHPEDAISIQSPTTFHFAAVTDLDELSKVPDFDPLEPKFNSFLLPGTLSYDTSTNTYRIEFSDNVDDNDNINIPPRQLISGHNQAGRGMELSELTLFENRLLSVDDKTGSVFEILSEDKDHSYVVPRYVLTEGNGDTDRGMKWEWSTVKDGKLYLGSIGKEYVDTNNHNPDYDDDDGTPIVNSNNLWIATIDVNGEIERIDWTPQFNFVRYVLGIQAPGYVVHEAVLWSDHLRMWIFLPRRISDEMYTAEKDERKGSNRVVIVNEEFTVGQIIDVQFKGKAAMDPLHGFSSAAFVPGTKDRHIAAMRSVEEDCVGGHEDLCKQRSYMTVFDVLTGEVLLDNDKHEHVDEVQIKEAKKYEGLEFVDITDVLVL